MTSTEPYARCLNGCGWEPDPREKRSIDSQANIHTNKTKHPTVSGIVRKD